MNKIKFLSVVAIGLLLSNLLLVAFIWFSKPKPHRHEGPRNIIIEKLDFDELQVKQYDRLIQWHRSEIGRAEAEIMRLKNQLYLLLNEGESNREKDSLIMELGKMQTRIEQVHYRHFADIERLCRADQKKNFGELTHEIARLFAPPHIKGRRP